MSIVHSLNGTDLASQDFHVTGTYAGWLSSPRYRRASFRAPGSAVGYLSAVSEAEDRPIRIPMRLDGVPIFSLAAIRAAEAWIKAQVDAAATLRVADGINTLELTGYLDGVEMEPIETLLRPSIRTVLEFTPDEVNWRSTATTTVGLTGTPAALAYGSAPCEDWLLEISGAFTNVTVTLAGQVCTWIGSRAGGQKLFIDGGRGMVYDEAGVDRFSGFAGAFALLPNAASTGAVTYGSGTPTATLTYKTRFR